MRIVSFLPSNTETICAIGGCDKLVGVDEYSDYPAQATKLPKVGNLYQPNIEAVVALKPDLVIVSKYGDLTTPLTNAGINVLAVNPETYEDVFSKTKLLGKIINREAQATALVTQMRRDIAKVEILTKNAARKPTAYYEIDPTPVYGRPQVVHWRAADQSWSRQHHSRRAGRLSQDQPRTGGQVGSAVHLRP